MAAEEDNFDIDIYGDGGEDYQEEGHHQATELPDDTQQDHSAAENGVSDEPSNMNNTNGEAQHSEVTDQGLTTHQSALKQTPQNQGVKRKEEMEERAVDAGATSALFISDLHWWITDDDIRGWANQCACEDELQDVTFHEHKVNGKSKGQAYILFASPQAATAVKHKIESFADSQVYKQKFNVSFGSPSNNPFKTLPKDGNARNNSNNNQGNRSSSGNFNSYSSGNQPQGNFNSNFRGGRGGYNNRGGAGGYNRGGFQQPVPGSYQSGSMSGFQSPMGGMQSYNNFGGRGGMMGGGMRGGMNMRGGRGGMNQGNMMGNYMGGGMIPNMAMAMPQMGAIGMQGFQNPGFFPQQGTVGDSSWNPHGAKRTRQE